jgi:MinD superfamily P-loop ATPase
MRSANSKGLPILLEIPFDRKIAESYSKGEMFVEEMPEWKQKFKDVFHRIEKIISCQKKVKRND